MKLSQDEAKALILLSEWTTVDGDNEVVLGIAESCWTTGEHEIVSERSAMSLAAKGLAKKSSDHVYITEEGRLLVESWRENGTWPVKVKL